MLFPYRYVPHKMEKIQKFIDFIFYEVWCKADCTEYGLHLFENDQDLYEIMDELFRLDLAEQLKDGSAKFFYEYINSIYIAFKSLTKEEIEEYKRYYKDNNNIDQSCSGVDECIPTSNLLITKPIQGRIKQEAEVFF